MENNTEKKFDLDLCNQIQECGTHGMCNICPSIPYKAGEWDKQTKLQEIHDRIKACKKAKQSLKKRIQKDRNSHL